METADFIVIGAGIAGSSIAYELAEHGRVLVLERESQAGIHSTGRSAALLTENYGNEIIRLLTIFSRRFYQKPPSGFADHGLLHPRGVLFIARQDQAAKVGEAVNIARTLVPSVELVSAARARQICPVLRDDYLVGAIHEPDAMDLDVAAIHQGYLRGTKRRGGSVLVNARIDGIEFKSGAWQVRMRGATVEAPILVNAAGAWCDEVAAMAGATPVGIAPTRRTAFTFEAPVGHDVSRWPLVLDVDEEFYFKPESGLILASPADETPVPPHDVQPEEIDIAVAVDRVLKAADFDIRHIRNRWAGLRSFSPDKTPVIGFDDSTPGFFWLAGQGGYGIMTAPALAQAACNLIVDRSRTAIFAELGIASARLSPSRFKVSTSPENLS